ncbi:glycosyltransferase family 4 protein [Actinomarinicola tropica]|uniref:glycosyltransferase family 4 protein n=1 Tax=Actinomarinicola tropica TaxID=2789776 RepID=UPI00189B9A14|nr:glycosyltransferase family 1 protein [Actinomarinicola tropica]
MSARVGVNLLWLVPGVVGGSETSTTTFLEALASATPDDLDHVLYVLQPLVDAYPEVVAAVEHRVLPLSGRVKGARVLAEQTWLELQARRDGVALVHHMGGTMPLVGGPPALLSIHDLQPFDHPERFHPAKRAWLSLAVPRAVRRARLVVTPSEWVRGTVIDRFGVSPERVVSVPHGMPPMDEGTPEDALRERYGLAGPLVVYPAITYPHKDHVTLVRAFAAVAARHPDAELVLPGGEAGAEEDVRAAIAASGSAARIRRLGRVPRADVVGLIDAAAVVAVPSRYEGFGIPALEAMARGRALVAADATALPEVVGDGGVLAAPGDVGAWAAALDRLLSDPAERDALGRRGRAVAASFSPERNLASTLAVQRRALGLAPAGGATGPE